MIFVICNPCCNHVKQIILWNFFVSSVHVTLVCQYNEVKTKIFPIAHYSKHNNFSAENEFSM